MKARFRLVTVAATLAACTLPSLAQTEIQWWHSMTAVNNEWVNDLAKEFNAAQKDYKIVPTYKGSYDESMTAAIAAFRAGGYSRVLHLAKPRVGDAAPRAILEWVGESERHEQAAEQQKALEAEKTAKGRKKKKAAEAEAAAEPKAAAPAEKGTKEKAPKKSGGEKPAKS